MYDSFHVSSLSHKTSSSQEEEQSTSREEKSAGKDSECRILDDLLRSVEDINTFGDDDSARVDQGEDIDNLDEKLRLFQCRLFRSPTFFQDKINRSKLDREEREWKYLKLKALEEEREAKEAETRASAFQFDFGYLDAEVYDLMKQLDSVYPDVTEMPNTATTKSMYSSTKFNIERLGLKVILNRVCVIGKYKTPHPVTSRSNFAHYDWTENDVRKGTEDEECMKNFEDELERIRLRTNSIFAEELGEITGCLLNYEKYFVLMMEGPELSIMDVLHQGYDLFTENVTSGCVLFIVGHVLVRYLKDWTDLSTTPPVSTRAYQQDIESAKENLVLLSETCQKLWKGIAAAKRRGISVNGIPEIFPEEKLLQYAIDCGLLRSFHTWLKRVVRLSFDDFTSETWPQIWYPDSSTNYKSDSQFDSLGVLDSFENIPGVDKSLENFIRNKSIWRQRESDDADLTGMTQVMKNKLVKKGSMLSLFSIISKDTAFI